MRGYCPKTGHMQSPHLQCVLGVCIIFGWLMICFINHLLVTICFLITRYIGFLT